MIPKEVQDMITQLLKDNWKKIAILGSAVAIGLGSISFFGKDNAIEQKAEQVIKQQTGLDIDLSP